MSEMYSRAPSFVFGFHGCDIETKNAVLHNGKELKASNNEYDWLGSGIYFWEQNYNRALEFATLASKYPGKYTRRPIYEPSVIGAVIDLGNCLNLMDSYHIKRIKVAYAALKKAAPKLPQNSGSPPDWPLRKLDRAVIESLHAITDNDMDSIPYDTTRGLFLEGRSIYPGGSFKEQTHIQICVRNINCIKGYFDPRQESQNPFDHLTQI